SGPWPARAHAGFAHGCARVQLISLVVVESPDGLEAAPAVAYDVRTPIAPTAASAAIRMAHRGLRSLCLKDIPLLLVKQTRPHRNEDWGCAVTAWRRPRRGRRVALPEGQCSYALAAYCSIVRQARSISESSPTASSDGALR